MKLQPAAGIGKNQTKQVIGRTVVQAPFFVGHSYDIPHRFYR
jgi:hypothetical protein